MRIIKHGTTSPLYVKPIVVGICPKCECTFEVEEKDKYTVYEGDYRSGGNVQVVSCPECRTRNIKPVWNKE